MGFNKLTISFYIMKELNDINNEEDLIGAFTFEDSEFIRKYIDVSGVNVEPETEHFFEVDPDDLKVLMSQTDQLEKYTSIEYGPMASANNFDDLIRDINVSSWEQYMFVNVDVQ